MSLFGSMNTAVSGMNAQTNRLSTVGDNIANADTTGYKRAEVKFSTFLLPSTAGQYNSGSVQSSIRYNIDTQGALKSTGSATDLAIAGRGFFIVEDAKGSQYLTRAGSFIADEVGNLVNPEGLTLMGVPLASNGTPALVNGLSGLTPINLQGFAPKAAATTQIALSANLDSRSTPVTGANLPSANAATAAYTKKVSVTGYDSQGKEVIYDIYYTKQSDPVAAQAGPPPVAAKGATWDVAVYRQDQATNGGFPYAGNGSTPLVKGSTTLTFDPSTNAVTSGGNISLVDGKAIPSQTIDFDFSGFSQLAREYSASRQDVDGQKASTLTNAKIDTDGTVYAIYSDNSTVPVYRIPLADVASPDGLEPLAGNLFRQTNESGTVFTGFPAEGAFGKTFSGSLEASNVDLATELTDMIQTQRNYSANTKMFQTGSDLMDLLVNLKR